MRRLCLAILALAAMGSAAQAADTFNPQPDPPGRHGKLQATHAFNPQPDPPGRRGKAPVVHAFNPQPDPPGRHPNPQNARTPCASGNHCSSTTASPLNPQPLPPRR